MPENPRRQLRSVPAPSAAAEGSPGAHSSDQSPAQAPRRPVRDDKDPGFFGPGSVSWRLHADPLTGVAALLAVLLSDLHPVAAAAAAEEGSGTWGRVERAAKALGTTTYGSRMAAMTCAARLRAEAAMVAGFDPATDRLFRGDDPDLLAWRHCCAVESRLLVARAAEVELSEPDADTYVGEQLTAALLLGLEPDEVPATEAELDEHLAAAGPLLQVPPGGRERALALAAGQLGDGATKAPPWAPVAGLAVALLPEWAAGVYELPEQPSGAAGLRGSTLAVALRTLRTALSETREGDQQPIKHLRLVGSDG